MRFHPAFGAALQPLEAQRRVARFKVDVKNGQVVTATCVIHHHQLKAAPGM